MTAENGTGGTAPRVFAQGADILVFEFGDHTEAKAETVPVLVFLAEWTFALPAA